MSIIHLKGSIFQQVKFIGDYTVKDGLISIKWKEVLQRDFVYTKTKLLGFIPWEKRSIGWVKADIPETPNPYIIPLTSIDLIDESK